MRHDLFLLLSLFEQQLNTRLCDRSLAELCMAPQSVDYRRIRRRIQRTFAYGNRPIRRLSAPLCDYVVNFFDRHSPCDYMKPETLAAISSSGCADPYTLVIAMVYLDRLRRCDKKFFEMTSPAELYVPSMMLAAKFLYDSDAPERFSNTEWAECSEIDPARLRQLEFDVVMKMKWDCAINRDSFEEALARIESFVGSDFQQKYGFTTYSDLTILSKALDKFSCLNTLYELLMAFGLTSIAYVLAVVSLWSTSLVMQPTTSDVATTPEVMTPTPFCLPNKSVQLDFEDAAIDVPDFDEFEQNSAQKPSVYFYKPSNVLEADKSTLSAKLLGLFDFRSLYEPQKMMPDLYWDETGSCARLSNSSFNNLAFLLRVS